MPRKDRSRGRATRARATTGVAGAIAVGAIFAVPAMGAQDPANGVQIREGNHILAVHNIDFIGAFGNHTPGGTISIDVFRGTHHIGHAAGPAVPDVEGTPGGLEANHGPEGVPQPGDCWDTVTPDVRPGDKIVITDANGGQDSTYIDEITFTGIEADPAPGSQDVLVTGVARDPLTGDPLPEAKLDSGAWRSSSNGDNRGGAPGALSVNPDGTYEARYLASQSWSLERGGPVDQAEVLAAGHEFGYGHPVVPPPSEIQLIEAAAPDFDAPGPALGCEGSPAAGDNAITTADDAFVNTTSGNLSFGGTAHPDVTDVEVTLTDGTTTINGFEGGGPQTSGLAGETEQGWTAAFAPADLNTLDQGTLTATATFTGGPGGTSTRTIVKDTVLPDAITASPPAGTHVGTQAVTLSGGAGDVIRYTRDGTVPNASSPVATGPISVPTSQTLTAVATDPAGNSRPAQTFAYTILPPPAGGGGGGQAAAPGAAPAVTPVTVEGPRPLLLGMLATSPRVKRERARNVGIRLAMRLPDGTEVVRIRIYRITGEGRRLISSGFKTPGASGLYRVRQNHRSLRRSLKVLGRYEVEVAPGRSRTDIGTTSRYGFRIVR